jgi:hypothetical protein
MGAVVSLFEDCFKGRRATFGGRRRALVNLSDMGVDIYEPAGMFTRISDSNAHVTDAISMRQIVKPE